MYSSRPRTVAFNLPVLPACRARHFHPASRRPVCQAHAAQSQSRRTVLRHFAYAGVATLGILPFIPAPCRAAEKLSSLEKNVVPVVMCRKIMSPVGRYIEQGEWDKGRTNVNYCTRILALRSRMRDASEQLDGDAFYDALDITEEMSNTMTQLDASLYTPLFIPSDEGISAEQRIYQQQAFGFYNDALKYLDTFLTKVPGEAFERAKEAASKAKYEIKFEFE